MSQLLINLILNSRGDNMEIWKDIVGYEGMYQVSNMGRVRSLDRIIVYKDGRVWNCKGRILSIHDNGKGYKFVRLSKYGKPKQEYIHRLVATAFIDNQDNLPEVNHKDENKENNCVYNLEWCSREYNHGYGTARQRQAEQHKKTNKVKRYVNNK